MSDEEFWEEKPPENESKSAERNVELSNSKSEDSITSNDNKQGAKLDEEKSSVTEAEPQITTNTEKDGEENNETVIDIPADDREEELHYSEDSFDSESEPELSNKNELENAPKTAASQKSISISTRSGTPWLKTDAPETKTVESIVVEPKEKKKVVKRKKIGTGKQASVPSRPSSRKKKLAVKKKASNFKTSSTGNSSMVFPSLSDPRALRDYVTQLHKRLDDATAENKTLQRLQKRQDAALLRAERQSSKDVDRRLVEQYVEEIRIMKEQLRQQREKIREHERLMRHRNDQLHEYMEKAKGLEKAFKEKGIDPKSAKKAEREIARLRNELEKSQTEVKELGRQLTLTAKNYKHQLNIEVARHKETTERLRLLESTHDQKKIQRRMPKNRHHSRPQMEDSLEDLVASTEKDLEMPKPAALENKPAKKKPTKKWEKLPSNSSSSPVSANEHFHDARSHRQITNTNAIGTTRELKNTNGQAILSTLTTENGPTTRSKSTSGLPTDFGDVDLLNHGSSNRPVRSNVDPFGELKPATENVSSTTANEFLDDLFGSKPKPKPHSADAVKNEEKKVTDFTDVELFPHKQQQANGGTKSRAKPLVDNGLFPWEKENNGKM